MMSQFEEFLRNAARMQSQQAGYSGLAGQQIFFDPNAQQQPLGTPVTEALKKEMAIRRCGNICLEARAAGWKVQFEGGPRQYVAAFISKDRQRYVTGKPYTTKQAALVSAADFLESAHFLRD